MKLDALARKVITEIGEEACRDVKMSVHLLFTLDGYDLRFASDVFNVLAVIKVTEASTYDSIKDDAEEVVHSLLVGIANGEFKRWDEEE